MKSKNNTSSVSFVDRIANILRCLSEGKNTATDIARSCNFNIATTHRLLNILKGPDLVSYDSISHRYYLGPLITQLVSNPNTSHQFLIMSTYDEMKHLSSLTEETVNLSGLLGIRVINFYTFPSKFGLRVHEEDDEENKRKSMWPLGATQKALLSQVDHGKLMVVLKSIKNIDDPLLDIELLKRELEQIRQQGYAISSNKRILGALGLSVPIKNYIIPLSLTVMGPETRLENKLSELIKELMLIAHHISNKLLKFSSDTDIE
jgi:DNA-binding IclR family transcriptional regulator